MTTTIDRLISAREAEASITPLDKIAGDGRLLQEIRRRATVPIQDCSNLLITGPVGSGKTAMIQGLLRVQCDNPYLFRESQRPDRPTTQSLEEQREWQDTPHGRVYLKVINGATDSPEVVRSKLQDGLYSIGADHIVVFIDELGELFFRGLEESLRPVLTEREITVYATAQNFHSKRKTDSWEEEEQRLLALKRRFAHCLTTDLPTEREHLRLLAYLVKEWSLKVDDSETLRLLVNRSKGLVGLSRRVLVQAIDTPGRKLTRKLVEEADFDAK